MSDAHAVDLIFSKDVPKGSAFLLNTRYLEPAPITEDMLTRGFEKIRRQAMQPDRIVVHPKMFIATQLAFAGIRWPVRDDLLPSRRRRWWQRLFA